MVARPFAMNGIPLASLLELLHNNQRRSCDTQHCSGATMQKHFLRRSPGFYAVTPLSPCDTSGVLLQRQHNCSHTCGHTHSDKHTQKKRGCICANSHDSTQTHATQMEPSRATESLVCTTGGKHPDLLRHDVREHALPRRNSRGNYSNGARSAH